MWHDIVEYDTQLSSIIVAGETVDSEDDMPEVTRGYMIPVRQLAFLGENEIFK
jgi:hypothetical protein